MTGALIQGLFAKQLQRLQQAAATGQIVDLPSLADESSDVECHLRLEIASRCWARVHRPHRLLGFSFLEAAVLQDLVGLLSIWWCRVQNSMRFDEKILNCSRVHACCGRQPRDPDRKHHTNWKFYHCRAPLWLRHVEVVARRSSTLKVRSTRNPFLTGLVPVCKVARSMWACDYVRCCFPVNAGGQLCLQCKHK